MAHIDELNLGELNRRGAFLRTREVLAIVHEVTRQAGARFPRAADQIFINDAGGVRVETEGAVISPREAVAALLETLLPAAADGDPDREVSAALRGLPARLLASAARVRPRDRDDLLAMLTWHLKADPTPTIQQLVARANGGVDAPRDDAGHDEVPWQLEEETKDPLGDLYLHRDAPITASLGAHRSPSSGSVSAITGRRVLGALLVALLFLAIGAAAYWLVRQPRHDEPPPIAARQHQELPTALATPVPSVTPPRAGPLTSAPLSLNLDEAAFSPSFAADGRELFFHAGRTRGGRLLIASLDDRGRPVRVSAVADARGSNYHLRVSPDGRLMAFDSDRDGERGVYVAERDGTGLQRVSGPGYAAVPSWSPDMKYLAFVRGEGNRAQVWNLWLRDLATGALQRHTAHRAGQVWGASWFPDGRRLCYSHEDRLVISSLGARRDTVIQTPVAGRLVRTPAVSPDGRSVIFQVFKDGVWLLDVQTRALRRILDDPTAEEFAWSPDGGRVAYHSRRDGQWKIWLMTVSS